MKIMFKSRKKNIFYKIILLNMFFDDLLLGKHLEIIDLVLSQNFQWFEF